MKTLILLVTALALFVSCKAKDKAPKEPGQPNPHGQAAGAGANTMTGVVLETMDVSGYTYIKMKTDQATIWAAAPKTAVKTGDTLVLSEPFPMVKYESKSLGRIFDTIYFAGAAVPYWEWVSGGQAGMTAQGQAGMAHPKVVTEDMELGKIEKVQGGVTIAEIFQSQDKFQGKAVLVRAKVVKASYGIMGKTWLHVRDGTGSEGGNELVVTTEETPKRGDLVLVRGTFAKQKDLGMGHRFNGIVEDAGVTEEK